MASKLHKVIHPGYIISRVLQREALTQKSLSERTGISEKHISNIINGESPITVDTALLLENVLGGTASFWINLQKNYEEAKARTERDALLEKEMTCLEKYPYAELVKRGCVAATKKKLEKVENLWKFFGVNSLEYVSKTEAVAYRVRQGADVTCESIAAWLRCGELEAKKISLPPFSESGLKSTCKELLELTTQDANTFSEGIEQKLYDVGVAVVYLPHFKGTKVNGSVRWVGNNPLIQLSLLGSYADIFWFTLFHEIGHILLHGKKDQFIEFKNTEVVDSLVQETEADNFAKNSLISPDEYGRFVRDGDFSRNAIVMFANHIGIHSGIVAGRLARENIVPWKAISSLRVRLAFKEKPE